MISRPTPENTSRNGAVHRVRCYDVRRRGEVPASCADIFIVVDIRTIGRARDYRLPRARDVRGRRSHEDDLHLLAEAGLRHADVRDAMHVLRKLLNN